MRDEVEAETEVLADQLRVMQGEVTRTTSASARDMGTLLAESQRQSQEAATARLDAIDRAGAARQRAANDALLAQLQVLETRLKNLEDTNANRLDGVRATLSWVYTPIKPPGLVWFCCICSMRPNTRVWEPLSQKPVR